MKKAAILFLVFTFTFSLVNAQDKPASSDEIMEQAIKIAKKEKKDIFLMFHASWCGWCKRMDAAMQDESCKEYFDNNFVIIHMVVKESAANKALENPGADELLAKYKGDKSGIPFWLIFDSKGEMVTDSFMRAEGVSADEPGDNIGCPAQDNEVAEFITKLKMVSKMTAEEEAKITERFKKNRSTPR